jgi:hypothetical protein
MDLRSTQLKDTYGNLLTIGTTEGAPTSGTLENGQGADITALDVAGTITSDGLTSDGNISLSGNGTGTRNVFLGSETASYAGAFRLQAGGSSASFGGGLTMYGHSHASKPGDVAVGISSGSGGSFRVNASGVDSGLDLFEVKSTSDIAFFDGSGNEAFYWDASAGSLGIGTTSPSNLLHIRGSSDGGTIRTALFENNASLVDSKAEIMLVSGGNTTRGSSIANINESASGQPASMVFSTSSAFATPTERMRIDSSGNVGINNTSPSSFLSNGRELVLGDGSASHGMTIFSDSAGTGNLFFADGTTGDEAYRGFLRYSHSSDSMDFYTAGANLRMRIDSSGNVGIGATSPRVALDVAGEVAIAYNATYGLRFYNEEQNNWSSIGNNVATGSSDANLVFKDSTGEVMRIDGGNVGIGTDSITSGNKLHIKDSDTQIELEATGGSNSGFVDFDGTSLQLSTNRDNKSGAFSNTSKSHASMIMVGADGGSYIRFNTASANNTVATEAMRIDSSGDVRLSGTAPNAENTISKIDFYNNSSSLNLAGIEGKRTAGGTNYGSLIFNTTNSGTSSEKMRIDSSGNVGIGETNPTLGKLVVKDDYIVQTDGTRNVYFGSDGTGALIGTTTNHYTRFVTNNTERMRIDSSGNVLIGQSDTGSVTTGSAGLYATSGGTIVTGKNSTLSRTHYSFYNPNGNIGSITTSGSATAFNTSSDYRLKENVVEMTGALDRVDQLKPSRFNFIADADTIVDGFLAHEVADVVPEAISGEKDATEEYEVTPAVLDDEGNVIEEAVMGTRPVYQGIDHSKLVPLLVGAIQELRAEIEQLKNQ